MELAARRPQERIREVRDLEGFARLAGAWDALAESVAPGQPFHRHAFVRIWLEEFAPRAQLRVLLIETDEGRLEAALPLVLQRTWLCGLPMRELRSASNPHSCRFDLLARDPVRAAALLMGHLEQQRDWDGLRLLDVPDGGAGEALWQEAFRRGLPVGRWESLRSPHFTLPAEPEQLHARLETKFKANLRRRRRKLAQKGALQLERHEGGAELMARLEEGFALEGSGWKGRRGSAIAQDPATRGFYVSLARHAAREGSLALYFLRVDGRAVAFHFALERGGTYFLLKPGYDETLGDCSPGQLLMEDVLGDLIARGIREFDFLGPDMTWKRDWADRARVHTWLSLFRSGPYGRALHAAKFRAAPLLKEVFGSWLR